MTWMQTYSGQPFDPVAATPDDVYIVDIAHSLGMQCRFNGHCLRFYSVAEHCVHLSYTVDPEHATWALLHDATEAYVGDMVRPLKDKLPAYRAAEDRLMNTIAEKFNLPGPMPAQVKEHDTRIVADEKAQLMAPSRLPWPLLEGYAPLGVKLEGWGPDEAASRYLSRFLQLFM